MNLQLNRTLQKIEAEVDLKDDVFHYLKNGCEKIDDIINRLEELSLKEKTQSVNIDLPFRIEKVINKHIPEIIEGYLNFSVEYRNNEKIEYEGSVLTPKEIVLKQVGIVLNEINEIEHDFYEINKSQLKAQGKFLESKYGKKSIVLENKYKNNERIKDVKIQQAKLNVSNEKEDILQKKKQSALGSFFGFFTPFIMVFAVMGVSVFAIVDNVSKKEDKFKKSLNNISSIARTVSFYRMLKEEHSIKNKKYENNINILQEKMQLSFNMHNKENSLKLMFKDNNFYFLMDNNFNNCEIENSYVKENMYFSQVNKDNISNSNLKEIDLSQTETCSNNSYKTVIYKEEL